MKVIGLYILYQCCCCCCCFCAAVIKRTMATRNARYASAGEDTTGVGGDEAEMVEDEEPMKKEEMM